MLMDNIVFEQEKKTLKLLRFVLFILYEKSINAFQKI